MSFDDILKAKGFGKAEIENTKTWHTSYKTHGMRDAPDVSPLNLPVLFPITCLSNDIIVYLFPFVSRRDLVNLASTSRRFRDLAKLDIFKYVKVDILDMGGLESMDQLENSGYTRRAESFRFRSTRRPHDMFGPTYRKMNPPAVIQILRKLDKLLKAMPKLKMLDIDTEFCFLRWRQSLGKYEAPSYPTVQTLTLHLNRRQHSPDVLLSFPRLTTLVLAEPHSSLRELQDVDPATIPSTLTHLRCSLWSVSWTHCIHLLPSLIPQLIKLDLHLIGPAYYGNRYRDLPGGPHVPTAGLLLALANLPALQELRFPMKEVYCEGLPKALLQTHRKAVAECAFRLLPSLRLLWLGMSDAKAYTAEDAEDIRAQGREVGNGWIV